jgi:DNA-binding transcriptional regulator YiaG
MTTRMSWTAGNPPMAEGEVGRCLREAGVGPADLARLLGISTFLVYNWRSGKRQPSAAVRWLLRYMAARGRGEADVVAI